MNCRSVLAVNRGSSSLKFALFTLDGEPSLLQRGTVDLTGHDGATKLLASIDGNLRACALGGIGHRIVHGGPEFQAPVIITPAIVGTLTRLIPFAPNHLPDEIELIEALGRAGAGVPQFACFDTAFHHDLPDLARRLPIPQSYASAGLRRYGFHGLSYSYLSQQLRRVAGERAAEGKVVLAHLGSGSSLVAMQGGRSMDTTMGLTPIGGVVMSTRTGDLDPGVVTYIARTTGLGADEVEGLLSRKSGLMGISDATGDMRELLAREAADDACSLAVSIYCYEIRKRIGSYAAALGGLETLVFSGGIGEHAPGVRARICQGLAFLGLEIDDGTNAANAGVISPPGSRVVVRVIPTDEEVMIAQAGYRLLH